MGSTNLFRKSIPNSGSIKSKAITKGKTNTLSVHGTIRTIVRRTIWSKNQCEETL